MKQIINAKDAPPPLGPYSHSVRAGNLLFVSGQIALDKQGQLHIETLDEEVHLVMKNIETILKESKLGFKDVVKASIFLKNMNDFLKVNEIYGQYFDGINPARECVQVSKLPKDVNVEISVMAYYETLP